MNEEFERIKEEIEDNKRLAQGAAILSILKQLPKRKITQFKVVGENFLRDLVRACAKLDDPSILLPYINQLFEKYGTKIPDGLYHVMRDKEDYVLFLQNESEWITTSVPAWELPDNITPKIKEDCLLELNYFDRDTRMLKFIKWTGKEKSLISVVKKMRARNYFNVKLTDAMLRKVINNTFRLNVSLSAVEKKEKTYKKPSASRPDKYPVRK